MRSCQNFSRKHRYYPDMRTHLNIRHSTLARVTALAIVGCLTLSSCGSGTESDGVALDERVEVVSENIAVDGDRNAAIPGADDGRPFSGANCCVSDITDVDATFSVTTGRESPVGLVTGGVTVLDNRFLVDRAQPRIDSPVYDVLSDGQGGYFAAAPGRFQVGTATRISLAHVTQAGIAGNDVNLPAVAGQPMLSATSIARVGSSTFIGTYSNVYRVTNDAIEMVNIAGYNKRVASFGDNLVVVADTGGLNTTMSVLDEQLRLIDTATFWHEGQSPSVLTFVEGENLYVAGRFDGFTETRCGHSSDSSVNFRIFTLSGGCLNPTDHSIDFQATETVTAMTSFRGGIVLAVKSGINTIFRLFVVTEAEARTMPDTNMPTVQGEVTHMVEFGLNLVYSLKYPGFLRLTGGTNGDQAINTGSTLWHLAPSPAGSTPTSFEGRLTARTVNDIFDLDVTATKLLVATSGQSPFGGNTRGPSWYIDRTGLYKKAALAGYGDLIEAINGGRHVVVASYGSVRIVEPNLGTVIAEFQVTRNGRSEFISDMAVAGNKVYVVGTFDSFGGQPRNGLAQIDVAAAPVLGQLGATLTFYASLRRQIFPMKVEASDVSPFLFLAASRNDITSSIDGRPQSFLPIEIATAKVSNWIPRNDAAAELLDMTLNGNQLIVTFDSTISANNPDWQSVYTYQVGGEPAVLPFRATGEPKDTFKSVAVSGTNIVAVNALNDRDVRVFNTVTRTMRRIDFGGSVTRVKKSTDGVWVLGRFTSVGQSRAEAPVKIDLNGQVKLSDGTSSNLVQLVGDTGNTAVVQSRVVSVSDWAAPPGDAAPGDSGGGAGGAGAGDPVVGINLPPDTQIVDSPAGSQVVSVDDTGVVRPADGSMVTSIQNVTGVNIGTVGESSPTVVATPEARRVVISSIAPGNKSLSITWSSATVGENHIARTSDGSRTFTCSSKTNSCVISGLNPVEVYSITVAPESDASAASIPSVFVKPIVTAKKGASVRASAIISVKASGKKSWKVRGGCTLSGNSVKMPKKSARCSVTLTVAAAKKQPRKTYSATVVVG